MSDRPHKRGIGSRVKGKLRDGKKWVQSHLGSRPASPAPSGTSTPRITERADDLPSNQRASEVTPSTMHITEGHLHSRGSDAAAAVKRQDAPTPTPTIQTPHGIDGDASRVETPSLRSEVVRNDDPSATPLPDRTSSQVDGNANRIQPLPRTNEIMGTENAAETDNNQDRPATGIARANDAPEPVKNQAPLATQPLDESDKPKGLLSVTGSLLQMVLKKVPDAVDSNPVKIFFSLAKIILQFKEGMEDNKDAIKQDMDAYAAQIATIEAAQADWKDGDAPEETEAMDEFKK
ncbi:hypothetical protein BKA70DRAFT_1227177 [Coprinopsis sp. MPI-PUGE-AT-0042]|nr:hypothetical protein BKA70DRAFT_1227177 [Coprinopsis sp. MPI-PUGE-AT-0042]